MHKDWVSQREPHGSNQEKSEKGDEEKLREGGEGKGEKEAGERGHVSNKANSPATKEKRETGHERKRGRGNAQNVQKNKVAKEVEQICDRKGIHADQTRSSGRGLGGFTKVYHGALFVPKANVNR